MFGSRLGNIQSEPIILTDVKPLIPRVVAVAIFPLIKAEKALFREMEATFYGRKSLSEEEVPYVNSDEISIKNSVNSGTPWTTRRYSCAFVDGYLPSELQRQIFTFISICEDTFRKVMKIGHWLAAWEIVENAEVIFRSYSNRIEVTLCDLIRQKLYKMYGHFENQRQLGLHNAERASSKTELSMLPNDQLCGQGSSGILLHLYSMNNEERRQLLFGGYCKTVEETVSSSFRVTPRQKSLQSRSSSIRRCSRNLFGNECTQEPEVNIVQTKDCHSFRCLSGSSGHDVSKTEVELCSLPNSCNKCFNDSDITKIDRNNGTDPTSGINGRYRRKTVKVSERNEPILSLTGTHRTPISPLTIKEGRTTSSQTGFQSGRSHTLRCTTFKKKGNLIPRAPLPQRSTTSSARSGNQNKKVHSFVKHTLAKGQGTGKKSVKERNKIQHKEPQQSKVSSRNSGEHQRTVPHKVHSLNELGSSIDKDDYRGSLGFGDDLNASVNSSRLDKEVLLSASTDRLPTSTKFNIPKPPSVLNINLQDSTNIEYTKASLSSGNIDEGEITSTHLTYVPIQHHIWVDKLDRDNIEVGKHSSLDRSNFFSQELKCSNKPLGINDCGPDCAIVPWGELYPEAERNMSSGRRSDGMTWGESLRRQLKGMSVQAPDFIRYIRSDIRLTRLLVSACRIFNAKVIKTRFLKKIKAANEKRIHGEKNEISDLKTNIRYEETDKHQWAQKFEVQRLEQKVSSQMVSIQTKIQSFRDEHAKTNNELCKKQNEKKVKDLLVNIRKEMHEYIPVPLTDQICSLCKRQLSEETAVTLTRPAAIYSNEELTAVDEYMNQAALSRTQTCTDGACWGHKRPIEAPSSQVTQAKNRRKQDNTSMAQMKKPDDIFNFLMCKKCREDNNRALKNKANGSLSIWKQTISY